MEDPAFGERLLAQQREQRLVELQAVEHHRQPVLAREGEVRAEHAHLALERGAGGHARPVEPALPDRHRAPTRERQVELGEVPVVVPRVELGEELRVDAEAEVDARRRRGQRGEPRPAVRAHRRDDELRDARRPGALDDPVAIGRRTRACRGGSGCRSARAYARCMKSRFGSSSVRMTS